MHVTDTGQELCFRDLCQINSGEWMKIHTIYRPEIKLPQALHILKYTTIDNQKHPTNINKKLHLSLQRKIPSSLGY